MVDLVQKEMNLVWAETGDIIQPDDTKISNGWDVELVPRQWWNWMQNRVDNNVAYLLQKGFPEWSATVEYIINKSYVQYLNVVYKCIQTHTNQAPAVGPYWVKAFAESSVSLEALHPLTVAADKLPYFIGPTSAATTTITAFARSILDDADAVAVRTTIGAQAADATLQTLAGLTTGVNKLPYFSGVDTATTTDLTAFGRSLLDDVDAGTARATLGLGTIATQYANAVTIDGGSITGITDLAIADGGTGASNAATARTNLGLGSASTATVTTSTTDTIAGRVLKVGDFGLGGQAIQTQNFNTITVAGRYYNATTSDTGLPNAEYWELEHLTSYQPSVFTQRAVGVGSANIGHTYTRGTTTGAAGLTPWVQVVREGDFGLGGAVIMGSTDLNAYPKASGFYFAQLPTGNAPPGVSSNYAYVTQNAAAGSEMTQTWVTAAVATQMFFRRTVNGSWGEWVATYTTENILGSVSQSAGVPTGAIIERGSNANGEYVRWADGTQICMQNGISFTAGSGGMTNISGSYPAPFISAPSVSMGDGQPVAHEDVYGFSRIYSASNQSQWSVGYRNGPSGSQTIAAVSMFAIGRWY